ncbi:SGNH hydrolase-type esterase domain-containing protein [Apodospora peruviana]|uniref:SGNH hydrolase-type esterase domain-containing protein n=1 Tax=Apodospora peruviana TaxID=516989 RepID=A0AAE0I705_9PEZI|nr:SGNH hydrolase-type esterase domain-containing protein [Apodospora peruviana]
MLSSGFNVLLLGSSRRISILILSSLCLLLSPAFSSPLTYHGVAVNQPQIEDRALEPNVLLRIMPLGASITYGVGSTLGNGYRRFLRLQLVQQDKLSVNMVGETKRGSMADNEVEGFPGYRIDEVHTKAVPELQKDKPNVVLLNLGTNDASQDWDIVNAGQRMEALLSDIYKTSPRAVVLLSTLLPNKNQETEERVLRINDQYRALVKKLRGKGRKIVLVEFHDGPARLTVDDLKDDTHPNDNGYKKMADIWYAGLVEAGKVGLLEKPETVEGEMNRSGPD